MGGTRPYDQTVIDWTRIQELADQAARQTAVPPQSGIVYRSGGRPVEAIGRHWLLHSREHHLEEPFDTGAETQHVYYFVVLLPDGSLQTVTINVDEDRRSNRDFSRTTHRFDRKHSVDAVSDRHTEWFDFEKVAYAGEPDDTNWKRWWGDLYPQHSHPRANHKGEGLEEALRELLGGNAPQQWEASRILTQDDAVPPPLESPSTPLFTSTASGIPAPQNFRTNRFAAWSMTASLAAILCVFPAGFGVLFGIIALMQIGNTGEQGRGLALSGIALGLAVAVFWAYVVVY